MAPTRPCSGGFSSVVYSPLALPSIDHEVKLARFPLLLVGYWLSPGGWEEEYNAWYDERLTPDVPKV
jgi:hypothetical protein